MSWPLGILFRTWRTLTSLVMVACMAAGCQGSGVGYLENGIGSDLPSASTGPAIQAHEIYFNYLCRQSGIGESCNLPLYDAGGWSLVVQQGMNDIDRRCDAYLQWLDDKKRSRGPLLSQVKDAQSATAALIGVFDPSNAIALQVVAQAFNLITRSIENYHSRLLLEIDQSTVNTIVLNARHDFRSYIRDKRIVFGNRPEAEHALRSYLRLCLPFAIEAKINNFSTLGASGGRPDENNTLGDLPIVRSATEPLPKVTEPPKPEPGRVNPYEANLGRELIVQIQEALCVKIDGGWGAETRAAVVEFYNGAGDPRPEIATAGMRPDDMIRLREAMREFPRCNATGAHKSAFELGQLAS